MTGLVVEELDLSTGALSAIEAEETGLSGNVLVPATGDFCCTETELDFVVLGLSETSEAFGGKESGFADAILSHDTAGFLFTGTALAFVAFGFCFSEESVFEEFILLLFFLFLCLGIIRGNAG